MPSRQSRTPIFTSLVLIGVTGAVIASLVLAISDPAPTIAPPPSALAVETRVITPQERFSLQRTFSGRVQARRQSELGFESAGRLAHVWVDEGATVEAGQLLAELDTERQLAQRNELLAARAEAEANLSLAKVTFKRLRGIVDKGGVSRQDLDESREAQRAAEAALSLADQRIKTIDVELAKSRLVAPFDATVIARGADEGRVLEAGHPILTLQERTTPEIRVGIAGRSLDQLTPGSVYPVEWRGQTVAARLRALLPLRASTARTVDALFDPIDPPLAMLAGDLVILTLDIPMRQQGNWLPLSAMTEGDRGLWSVYVAEPLAKPEHELAATHHIVRRTVDIVYQSGDRVFVKGSFNPDQRVVVSGVQRIVPGQAVRLTQADVSLVEVDHE
ncbi:MAG: efflux RND transporter periplasmic adaptor subunit [Candidatus Thiodiazotropha sp.]